MKLKEEEAHHRDVANFVFWTDNCSAQNKNWHLFTLFTTVVNGKDVPHLNSITMKEGAYIYVGRHLPPSCGKSDV